jgi:hypothetical protein
MAYIGQGIKQGTFKVLDTSGNTYNGSNTTFSLGTQVGSAAQLLVSHDGVIQLPGTDYTLATGGTQITFSTAPASGASIFITEISGAVGGTVTPSDNSVGVTQLNLSDGSNGQFIKTDGSGTLSFATVDTSGATDSFAITGSTPTLTIGDAGAEDTKIVFDGNAQDFHIGLDDSADSLTIGLGSTLGTTSHMVIDATGAVTKPLQPAFLVKSAAMNNLATATTHDVQFSTEVFDNNADFNTSNYTFTAPVTGRYCINVQLKINNIDTAGDYYNASVNASNNGFLVFYYKPSQLFSEDANAFSMSSTMLIDMDANDTAKVDFRPQAGSAQADINANESLFSGFLVC